jgi:hypothetical protein
LRARFEETRIGPFYFGCCPSREIVGAPGGKENLGQGNDRTLCEGGKKIRHPWLLLRGVNGIVVSVGLESFDSQREN